MTFTEDSTQHTGSHIRAGETAAFVATGDAASESGNLTIAGSDIDAREALLQANNRIDLLSSVDTNRTRSTNESKSASVGVSYGVDGVGVSGSVSYARGEANADASSHNNTHINASDRATLVSGGDTNVVGANVNAKRIVADIGGDLNIASMQDTSRSAAHQYSGGGGFAVSTGGASGSFSVNAGQARGNYEAVNEQSGLQAGEGGFEVTVKGNTDLKGGYLASTASAPDNRLSTGTLSWSDVMNRSTYRATSGGMAQGGTTGNGGNNYATHGASSGKNTGGVSPMLVQHDSGSQSALTRSAVEAGSITITDEANQVQDVAMLNRDTSALSGTVARTPDLQSRLNRQAEVMTAVQAAGEVVAKQIGRYANGKHKAALEEMEQAKARGDAKLAGHYEAQAERWSEGGKGRALMQAAGAAVTVGLGGGNAVGAAAGAGVASLAGGKLDELAEQIRSSKPTGNADVDEALANIVANSLATVLGVAVGGNAGAVGAYNVDRFNRQLHPEERGSIERRKKSYAKQTGLTVDQAEQELLTQANLMLQNGSPGQWNERAAAFLRQERGMLPADGNSGPGYIFYATPEQKANTDMYAKYYPSGVGMNAPTADDIANSASREQMYRDAYAKGTWGAAAGAATIAFAAPVAMIPGAPLLSTNGALGSSAWASPVGAGTVSATTNAVTQYLRSGSINWVDVAGSFGTGYAGSVYAGLARNVGINILGGATTTALNNILQGKSDSVVLGGAASGVGSIFGYGIGKSVEAGVGSLMRPTMNSSGWADVGKWSGSSGLRLFTPNNVPAISSSIGGSIGFEFGAAEINSVRDSQGGKK
ncbi:hemagglutinin repeat-containing protein [Trinickia sp. LjRoot230]|uniref:hemagglutinin repeat-containing protein n=1 Tax=Trinickia sp. LjRoot230 TaxID=3342288 RepID=UPI003ECE3209